MTVGMPSWPPHEPRLCLGPHYCACVCTACYESHDDRSIR